MEAQPEYGHQPTHPTEDLQDFEEFEEDDDDDEEEEEGDDDDDDEDEDEEQETESVTPQDRIQKDRANVALLRRLSSERVPVRVHDIVIKGNCKTNDSFIQSEVEAILTEATNFQQLLRAATDAHFRLQHLDLFDSVKITLDAGPPGTANVVIEVSEAKNSLTGDLGIYSKPEARSWMLEGSLKLKNLFGYGDLWDGSVSHGWGQASEVSAGVSLPKFKALAMPLSARISLPSQDWLKFSSHRERVLGLSLGLLSTGSHDVFGRHDVFYNLSWRKLTEPSQISSDTVQRHLGHSLFSALKYTFKIDWRDSPMRPTRGCAFVFTTQIGGLFPDIWSLRLIRQEFDLRYAIPLGFYQAALNFGISGGVVIPCGSGDLNTASYLAERFFIGGTSSPVCSLKGPTSVLGFKARGLGPAVPRRLVKDNSNDGNSDHSGVDHIGGGLALTSFADFSFDLPSMVFRELGIYGHVFACAGSLNKLTQNAYREFSFQKFRDSFRSSAGFGIIVPTKLFRMEVNYCYILKQHELDRGKTGVQFSFSSPL